MTAATCQLRAGGWLFKSQFDRAEIFAVVHLKWRQGLREEERDFMASASMDGDD